MDNSGCVRSGAVAFGKAPGSGGDLSAVCLRQGARNGWWPGCCLPTAEAPGSGGDLNAVCLRQRRSSLSTVINEPCTIRYECLHSYRMSDIRPIRSPHPRFLQINLQKRLCGLLCRTHCFYKLSRDWYMVSIGLMTAAMRNPTIAARTMMIIGSIAAISCCVAISTSSS